MPKLPLTIYYGMSAAFSAILFIMCMIVNANISGFLSFLLVFGKFIPAALCGLSILYLINSKNGTDTNFTDLGIGLKIGKALFYLVMLASVVLTLLLTVFGASATTGILSFVLDFLSFFAVVMLYFTYANYTQYASAPLVETTAPATPAPPPAPTTTV